MEIRNSFKLLVDARCSIEPNFKILIMPGLSQAEIKKAMDRLPSNYVDSFFQAVNGVSTGSGSTVGGYYLIPGFAPLSLEAGKSAYEKKFSMTKPYKGYFPIFTDFSDGYWAVNLSAGDVVRVFIAERSLDKIFSSPELMANALLEAFRRGAFYFDSSGYLEQKDREFVAIVKEFSDCPFWNSYL
jgi:hypothetical protein